MQYWRQRLEGRWFFGGKVVASKPETDTEEGKAGMNVLYLLPNNKSSPSDGLKP